MPNLKINELPQESALEYLSEVQMTTIVGGSTGAETIKTMSAYCQVPSACQEAGNVFNSDIPAGRNYAAAATLRSESVQWDS